MNVFYTARCIVYGYLAFIYRQLLVERKALKEDAPLIDRLVEKAMSQHIDE